MEDMDDVVVVKESKCFFIGNQVDIEYCAMHMCLGVLGLEVWD